MRIAALDFDEWLALEGQTNSGAYDRLRSKYRREPPYFLHQRLEVDPALVSQRGRDETLALLEAARPEIEAFAKALHLYLGTAPIDPLRSVTYFDARTNGEGDPALAELVAEQVAARIYGESDKEYVVQNHDPQILLSAAEGPALERVLALVRRARPVWSDARFQMAWESLALSSAPGLGWPSRVLMTVGALEALVMPELKEGLQKAFERRVALLTARDNAAVEQLSSNLRPAYRIRSDIVHGRPLDGTLARLPLEPATYLNWLNRVCATAICRLVGLQLAREAEPANAFGAFLETTDPAAIDELLSQANAHVTHRWQDRLAC
jgi:hypothetical protein